MSRVTRGEKLLSALAASDMCELSKAGSDYVKERFDPYHDLPMKPVGYPDSYNGSTVTRCIKKSVTISATSGGGDAPSTTWSCHIFDTPLEKPVTLKQNYTSGGAGSQGNNNVFADDGNVSAFTQYGGIMAVRSDNQQWTYPSVTADVVGRLNLSDNDLKNVMRVVSSGWEVIDETAELYKQGTLTAYRQNQQQNTPQVYTKVLFGLATGGGQNSVAITSGQLLKFPPANVAAAMLSPNTKQWLVKEGAYVVTDYNSDEIPMTEPTYIEPVMMDDNVEVLYGSGASKVNTNFWMPQFDQNQLVNQNWTNATTPATSFFEKWGSTKPNKFTPKNQSGVFLTGMNAQASITLNKIWYVECAPTGEDEELLSLCSQSPEYDPIAMKIVASLRRDSPIAVKLRENYLGKWFFDGISDFVKSALPWLSNAKTIGKQVVKWVDNANTNEGYINPQSFVKGDVAKKVAREKPKKQAIVIKTQGKGEGGQIPKAPGPLIIKKAAFKPKTIVVGKNKIPEKMTRSELIANVKAQEAQDLGFRQANWIRKKKSNQTRSQKARIANQTRSK